MDAQSELPEIYKLDNGLGPQYLIIAGTHGNEVGPCGYLKRFVQEFHRVKKFLQTGTYIVIPEVNPLAVRAGVRHLRNQPDINRSYPKQSTITRYLDPLMRSVDRVVDFHEAWGFNQCQSTSLGQTLYTNDSRMRPLLQKAADTLSARDIQNRCGGWTVLDELPVVGGAIDEYLSAIGIPYVLAEIAGQNGIQSFQVREDTTEFILEDIFLKPEYYTKKYYS